MTTLDIIFQTFAYVVNNDHFWVAMAFTTIIGLLIGASIYDGDIRKFFKGLLALGSYMIIIIIVNATRSIPDLAIVSDDVIFKPMASLVTIFIVSIFYFLGMGLGTYITSLAHGKKMDSEWFA